MEPEVLSPKQGVLSLDGASDPEEPEISEEDDDDRNHKHRRRETRSQSLERDDSDQVFTRSYTKPNRHVENGHPFREYERRRPGAALGQRVPFDFNQRFRSNQTFSGDIGPGRGRGRDPGPWNLRDSRFSSVDISSQMVQLGPMPPGLYGGRGLAGVSTAQNPAWPAFGMLPGVPNGGLDSLHPMGLQGMRPNMGIPRQRCRDFEERGFCLRGELCPMEHGRNRIVVEDVQSLSQFNLPVSLPNPPLMTAPAGSVPSIGAAFTSTKGVNNRGSKAGITSEGLGYNDTYPGASGTDFYDPDQPLWNTNAAETSAAVTALGLGYNETESMLDDDHHGADSERTIRNSQSSSQSVWGRIGGSKSGSDARPEMALNFSDSLENKATDDQVASVSGQGTLRQGKRAFGDDTGRQPIESSSKTQSDVLRTRRRPTQKALRTLFVSGIPRESNRRDALLTHFQKFGKVIDIRIILNSERAFVQFSKEEEAEAALLAPDAVMGNRFINLLWANRDSIPDSSLSSGHGISATPRGRAAALIQNQCPVSTSAKDSVQSVAPKATTHTAQIPPSSSDHTKPAVTNGTKVPPPQPKKSEALVQLKEELRKKQELLEQKRNEFWMQLAKLEKQASGVKSEVPAEQATKRLKVTASVSSDSGAAVSPHAEVQSDKSKLVVESPKLNTESASLEQTNLKLRSRPVATTSARVVNRYKLDNRPTTFRVIPPLPSGLANVDVLKEHFSSFGGVSNVELEDEEARDGKNSSETLRSCGACVTFTTRSAAEKAFLGGKSWHGQNMQFAWVASNNGCNISNTKEHPVSESKVPPETDKQTAEKSPSEEAAPLGDEELERELVSETLELREISQPIDEEAENPDGEQGVESLDLQGDGEASPAPGSGADESPEADAR